MSNNDFKMIFLLITVLIFIIAGIAAIYNRFFSPVETVKARLISKHFGARPLFFNPTQMITVPQKTVFCAEFEIEGNRDYLYLEVDPRLFEDLKVGSRGRLTYRYTRLLSFEKLTKRHTPRKTFGDKMFDFFNK